MTIPARRLRPMQKFRTPLTKRRGVRMPRKPGDAKTGIAVLILGAGCCALHPRVLVEVA